MNHNQVWFPKPIVNEPDPRASRPDWVMWYRGTQIDCGLKIACDLYKVRLAEWDEMDLKTTRE